MGFYPHRVPKGDSALFGGLKDVGIDCHSDQSEGRMASALQAMTMAFKGPVCPQNHTGRGCEGVEANTAFCVSFIS